jgi:transcriptional regulator with XRE-family HTH domain
VSVMVEESRALAGSCRHLGELVRAERLRQDMQQADLASRVGMSAPDISSLENGRKFVFRTPVGLLERLAEALASDQREKGRLLRAMMLLSGMKPEGLDAMLTFRPAMIRRARCRRRVALTA